MVQNNEERVHNIGVLGKIIHYTYISTNAK